MSNIFEDITKTIGSTPLVKINRLGSEDATILAKVESFNPCSSIKDRIACAMVAKAEEGGCIKPGDTIVEPTSGNTGIGLALVCAAKGYKLILTMPESMSIERRKILKILGAEIALTPAEGGMKGAIDGAIKIAKEKMAFMPQQFENPANPEVHRKTTALEIWDDTDGKVDFFVAGIGTGGTITGCSEVLKQKNPEIQTIGVEPSDSAVLSGENPGPHKIQGIGAGFVPDVLNVKIVDRITKITNDQAMDTARLLAAKEGILAGISSGAAMAAAIKLSHEEQSKGKTIVVVLPDTGERYISTEMFNI